MRKISVAMVLFPGFQLLDIAGPKDAFTEVRILSQGKCEYEMLTIGTTRGSVLSSSGLTVVPDRTIFDPCPHFDTVIVPGGLGIFEVLEDSTLSDWLRKQQKSSRRIAAICNGMFAFGSAGMLDNRTVTTHWMDAAQRMHISPRNLSRVFSKDCGKSLMAFLNDARINSGRRYLESSNFGVRDIARRCGFDSADALRRMFHRRLHINPVEYRNRFRSNSTHAANEPMLSRRPT